MAFGLCQIGGMLHLRRTDEGVAFEADYPMSGVLCTPATTPLGRDVRHDIHELRAHCCWLCLRAYHAAPENAHRKAPRTIEQIVGDLRTALRVGQRRFAEMMGTTQTSVSYWETGKHKPSKMARRRMRELARLAGDRGQRVLEALEADDVRNGR